MIPMNDLHRQLHYMLYYNFASLLLFKQDLYLQGQELDLQDHRLP